MSRIRDSNLPRLLGSLTNNVAVALMALPVAVIPGPAIAAGAPAFGAPFMLKNPALNNTLIFGVQDVEPSIRVDTLGNAFPGAIRGVPAGKGTAVTCKLAQPCFGATIALRRETLTRIGGIEPFADSLADDYSIGEAIRSTGAEVAISPVSVGHLSKEQSARELWAHELRWARTIRALDPIGYLGSLLTHPFPLALLAVATGSDGGAALAALALLCRVTLLKSVERRFGLERQVYWLLPVRDLISFAVLVWGLFGSIVSWNGESYQLTSAGNLVRRTML